MIGAILSALARLLGPILPFVAAWVAGWRDARQRAKLKRLGADNRALRERERIEDDLANETDLADRARRTGVLRKPGK